jgi:hypothetical protein
MTFDISTILPNISYSLEGTGFLFGAGTSFEAGYSMMPDMTRRIVVELDQDERDMLDEVLRATDITYNDKTAKPNIEEISDYVIAHAINSQEERCKNLEIKLKSLMINLILSVRDPIIDNHIKFFRALSKRAFGQPCTVWIFTTNYDLLFEIAAAKAGVNIENGFSGCIERFFSPRQFKTISGEIIKRRFSPNNQLTVKLVKLHGSISWVSEGGQIFERHPDTLKNATDLIMVLPRRKKVMETLSRPYESMFKYMYDTLGNECKYLLCCGFSFSDEHINQHLILPALQSGRIQLCTLNEFEPDGVDTFKVLQPFSGVYSNKYFVNGQTIEQETDIWKFSQFVNLF